MLSKNKMKIAFLITGLQSGGAERVMSNLANELVKRGHNIKIIVMKEAVSDYHLDERIDFVGASALTKSGKNNFFKGIGCYVKNVREYKPNIIVSFLPKTIIIAMLCRLFLFKNIPVIVCERANPRIRKGLIRKLNDKLFPLADGSMFQTVDAMNYYKIKNKWKTAVLKNPLSPDFDVERFTGIRNKEIVTAGRLYNQKNHSLLIDAFSRIADKYKAYTLNIYGDGPLMGDLKQQIECLNLSGRVILHGRVDDIKDKIYKTSLFVLSSDFEGMPNALLEAMAMGIPCISTDCPVGGPREIIENYKNGILVPVGDADKMAEAMDKVLSDDELAKKIGEQSHKIYIKFSLEQVAEEWEKFIYKIYEGFRK
jgi:glycosyltransferase involved in cell wall biosynthesis